MKGNGRRIFEESGVKYLVLLGKVVESSSEEYGDVLISIGFYGAGTAKMEAKLSAKVIDLQNERPLYEISSKAVGTAGGLGLFYGLFIVPLSEESAIEGLGEKIATALSPETALDSVRIAVMAMEPLDADYTLAERVQTLKKQLEEGDDSRELKMELERLGYTEPLKTPANEGDVQAIIDLYLMTGGPRAAEFNAASYHEAHCTRCHDSRFYTRNDRRINSFRALEAQVADCDANLATKLFPEDLSQLVEHLNRNYYKFSH
jgi:hypothetical protein